MKSPIRIIIFCILFFSVLICFGQANLENGWGFPVHTNTTPIHILLVSVELHGGSGTNVDCNANNNPTCFPVGQLPVDIDDYFDATLPSTGPTKFFTKYLFQSSLGQCVVLGDYLDAPVHVSFCPSSNPLSIGDWTSVIDPEIRNQFPNLQSHLVHSTPLSDFDHYSLENSSIIGMAKPSSTNGNTKFDCVIYLIKNFPNYGGGIGFGLTIVGANAPGVTSTLGTDLAAVFGHTGDIGSIKFIMEEFFHGLFGGNNWHSGTGKGEHTFCNETRPWGLESQHGCSQVVSGYDRWIFNWTDPVNNKNLPISARDDISNNELNTDLTIPSTPVSSIFILRDFVTKGDAIRIKLPHINCSSPLLPNTGVATGKEKNEYLWIENHQFFTSSVEDQNTNFTLEHTTFCGPWPTCGEYFSPGLLCAIQVGKDDLDGSANSIYNPSYNEDPNNLGSWMFPVTADVNHDFTYGGITTWNIPCIWANPFVAFDLSDPINTISNPFSGYSFMYGQPNTDGSTQLNDNDTQQGVAYIDATGTLVHDRNAFCDLGTTFKCSGACPMGGKEILSMSTNPAPVPVMTLTGKSNHQNGSYQLDPAQSGYEYLNRTIYLNGISIKILEENYLPATFGQGAVKVQINWDDYDVINDVRWCADSIRLSKNDFVQGAYSLNVKNGSKILIDRSLSPTYDYSDAAHQNFTVPTVFTCLKDSKANIEANGSIVVE